MSLRLKSLKKNYYKLLMSRFGVNFCFSFLVQAAIHLYEDCAKYPRKITYIYSPPHLACEALEVIIRVL